MKNILRKTLCVVLILVMAGSACANAFAAGEPKYISEVRIAYGDEGKAELKKAGYTVKDYNLNDGVKWTDDNTAIRSVWMGYKTSTNPDDAITDMAVMNMNGGYSFVAYEEVLNAQKEDINKMIESYSTAIAGLKANYKKDNPAARYAIDTLNLYYEDDTKLKLGAFLLSNAVTNKQLQTMFLEANADTLALVYRMIAIGLANFGEDSIAYKLENASIEDEYPRSLSTANRKLYNEIEKIQAQFKTLFELTDLIGFDEAAIAAYLDENGDKLSASVIDDINQGYAIYKLAGKIDYADTDMTLLDFFMQDLATIGDKDLYPLSAALTEGQVAAFDKTGLNIILQAEDKSYEEYTQMKQKLAADIKSQGITDPVSIYYGVDRTIYDPNGIALTVEASKATNNGRGSSWTEGDTSKLGSYDTARTPLLVTAIVTGIVALACGFFAVANINFQLNVWTFNTALVAVEGASYSYLAGIVGLVGLFLLVVCIAALCLFFAFSNMVDDYKYYDRKYDYTKKPRIMVTEEHDFNEDEFYGYYYAVRTLDDEIADLNGDDAHNPEWNVLYTTKDKRLGTPLTDDIIIKDSIDKPSGYATVHSFEKSAEGERAAYNMNSKTANASFYDENGKKMYRENMDETLKSGGSYTDKPAKNVYMFVKPYSEGAGLTGSVFTAGSLVQIIASLAVGFGIGAAVFARKKKEDTQTA